MDWQKEFPILIIDDQLRADNAEGRALRDIIAEFDKLDFSVREALSLEDGRAIYRSHAEIGCVLLDWDLWSATPGGSPQDMIAFVHEIHGPVGAKARSALQVNA